MRAIRVTRGLLCRLHLKHSVRYGQAWRCSPMRAPRLGCLGAPVFWRKVFPSSVLIETFLMDRCLIEQPLTIDSTVSNLVDGNSGGRSRMGKRKRAVSMHWHGLRRGHPNPQRQRTGLGRSGGQTRSAPVRECSALFAEGLSNWSK
jgi:hypothetical protein